MIDYVSVEMGLSADDLAVDLAPINVTNRLEEELVSETRARCKALLHLVNIERIIC